MSDLQYWEELRSADSDQLVLVVDWPVTETDVEGYRDLVSLMDTPHTVWRTRGTARALPWDAEIEEYVRPLTREIRESGLKVRAVLACGVAGVLAAVLSETVAAWQETFPEILLIDPEFVDTDGVYDEFLALIDDLSQPAGPDRLTRLRESAASVVAACGDDPTALATRLHALLVEAGTSPTSAADRPSTPRTTIGTPSTTQVSGAMGALERAAARLCVLAVADRADVIQLWARGTALCSSTTSSGLSRTRAALLLPEAELVGTEITFDIEHDGMLKDASVARTVRELIGA
ncbi:hypothetical protein [Streptomyces odontomachi]|uniref:hypothetical protein n=1 Tax=Streptomyces odontomachi TaxID=2944940 RepID=UPI00210EDA3E|nr:hypothetical protein [Streptomyces sp. ODS25]